ncbi:MAG TPA: type IV toxin-antitoxin system AbiEi family antitoxin [Paraburkholderia sp.]|nr:type IV toxin-antitoxin system AbiEi family antitoxin [Paraburkholderia sp.]
MATKRVQGGAAFRNDEQNKKLNGRPRVVHNSYKFTFSEQRRFMNKDDPTGALDFSRPTEALLGQLTHAVTMRGRVPLHLIGFRPGEPGNGSVEDGELTLDVNGAVQQYTLAARGRMRSRADVRALAVKNRRTTFPLLLATSYLTLALADECVEHDLQFIDLAGNLYVHTPGQYLLVTGRPANPELRRLASQSGRPATSASVSALRMIFVLLAEPQLLNRSYRDIAAAAGVALGAVGSVLDNLRERGLLAGTDSRRILDPAALREEWAISYPLRLLPKLNGQRFTAGDPSWWRHAELPAGQAWWSGEVAAAKLTGQLRPAAQTLYIDAAARPAVTMALAKRHRLRADDAGTLEILDAFWRVDTAQAQQATVPPLLVYADLQRTRDPRNAEAATLIRNQIEQADAANPS